MALKIFTGTTKGDIISAKNEIKILSEIENSKIWNKL